MWKYLCYAAGFIFGNLMLFGGTLALYMMPKLFEIKIKANLPIVNGTEAFTRYSNSNVPLQVKIYVFNVTNAHEVESTGAKPILSQVGPFSLSETRRRHIESISKDNTTLDYKLFRTHFFNPSESESLDVKLTLPNIPMFSAFFSAQKKKDDGDSLADPLDVLQGFAQNESIYQTATASELLFEGININWLDAFNKEGLFPDDGPENNKFGLFYKKNGTWDKQADGLMTISTGADGNFSNIGQVVRWNGMKTMSFWKGQHCNSIRGTDGQFFHPSVQKDEKLEIFAPDLCRTLAIEFVKTASIRSIELYRFGISPAFFAPINHNEETKCYCVKKGHSDKAKFCKLSGVVDMATCRNKPIVLSTPHFFNGDPSLREAVEGMSPSAANHDTFIDIEPMTGAVLRVRRRLQVNVEIGPIEEFGSSRMLKNKIIHPFIWMDQSVVIPDDLAIKLENKLIKNVRMIRILCYAAIITGPIILVATLIFICRDISKVDKKIRSANVLSKNNPGGDYQKVQVILKPINSTSGYSQTNNKE